jgi:gamma-glutamylcyclotransferase (GGCT)/AIG2-like uncharacterized protein YtfP
MVRQVFAYGTLKRGFSRFHLPVLARLRRRVEPAELRGTLYDLGTYPGLVLQGEGTVKGEVHLFADIEQALGVLDRLEGYLGDGNPANLFRRQLVEARDRRGRRRRCWTYVYAGRTSELQHIDSGMWRKPY